MFWYKNCSVMDFIKGFDKNLFILPLIVSNSVNQWAKA